MIAVITLIYTLSLHDALPIFPFGHIVAERARLDVRTPQARSLRSEEHTSELQSQSNLVCRLLLEKKNFPPAGVPDARAVPDKPGIRLGRGRRRGTGWTCEAWI